MNRNRIFRCLVCLILVCCLIIQVSPIRAKAIEPISASLAIGYVAQLIMAACGVVFILETADEVIALGNSMMTSLYQWGTSANKLDEVEEWEATLKIYDGALGGDNDRPTEDYKVKLARGILAGIAAWVCSVVLATTDIETEEEVEVGFAYYNGYLLPDDSTSYWYCDLTLCPFLTYVWSDYYSRGVLYVTDKPLYYDKEDGYLYATDGSSFLYYDRYVDNDVWKPLSSSSVRGASGLSVQTVYFLNLSGPTSSIKTEPIYPSTYVGDIPQKIEDGELDEETLVIPDINYAPLLQPDLTLEQSLQNTMQQLKDGTLTYDEFMEQIKVEEETETDPDATEDPSEEPTTAVDGDTWKPPTDPNAFALDLSNYFPFCIPFDLYDFLACLNADPVTPVIEWEIALPGGGSYPLELDLSPFDPVAQLLRRLQLLLFIIGLAFKTRDLIKG